MCLILLVHLPRLGKSYVGLEAVTVILKPVSGRSGPLDLYENWSLQKKVKKEYDPDKASRCSC